MMMRKSAVRMVTAGTMTWKIQLRELMEAGWLIGGAAKAQATLASQARSYGWLIYSLSLVWGSRYAAIGLN